jgi:hypothetical protein
MGTREPFVGTEAEQRANEKKASRKAATTAAPSVELAASAG